MSSHDAPLRDTLVDALWNALRGAAPDLLLAWARQLPGDGDLASQLSAAHNNPDEVARRVLVHLKYSSDPGAWISLAALLPERHLALQRAAALNGVTLPGPSPASAVGSPSPPGPSAPAPTTLDGLLTELFTDHELRAFLGLNVGTHLLADLPGAPAPLSQVAWEVVAAFQRRGLIRPSLFDALAAERPGRASEVRRVQALLYAMSPSSPPAALSPPLPPPAPPTADELNAALELALTEPSQRAALRAALAETTPHVPHLGRGASGRWLAVIATLGHRPDGPRHLVEAALRVAPGSQPLLALRERCL